MDKSIMSPFLTHGVLQYKPDFWEIGRPISETKQKQSRPAHQPIGPTMVSIELWAYTTQSLYSFV